MKTDSSRDGYPKLTWSDNTDDVPAELWQIVTVREFQGKPLRSIRFCHSEESAQQHVEEMGRKDIEVVRVTHYVKVSAD